MMQPVGIEANVGHGHKTTQRLVEALALDNFAHWSTTILRAEIGVEHPLPHGDQKNHVPLLPRVLLRDLQFDCLIGMAKGGKQG
jgi:hypothetical protein